YLYLYIVSSIRPQSHTLAGAIFCMVEVWSYSLSLHAALPISHDGVGLPGQVGRADEAGLVAEAGAEDVGDGAPVAPDQPALVGLADRLQDQFALLGEAAADDERGRVEEGGEVGEARADPAGQLAVGVDGHPVALARGHGHVLALDAVGGAV